MTEQDQKFDDFIGSVSAEGDDGWSKEVWDAAWQAALDSVKSHASDQVMI